VRAYRPVQTVAALQPVARKNVHRRTREIGNLDFGGQRVMFQKYGTTWLDFAGDLAFAACAADA
jgi:hypothetical protein